MIDPNSDEFKDLLAAWINALKTLDMRLQTYSSAVAALENSKTHKEAARYFKDAVKLAEADQLLLIDVEQKYRQAAEQCEHLLQQSNWQEALASWLREYRLETPKSSVPQN